MPTCAPAVRRSRVTGRGRPTAVSRGCERSRAVRRAARRLPMPCSGKGSAKRAATAARRPPRRGTRRSARPAWLECRRSSRKIGARAAPRLGGSGSAGASVASPLRAHVHVNRRRPARVAASSVVSTTAGAGSASTSCARDAARGLGEAGATARAPLRRGRRTIAPPREGLDHVQPPARARASSSRTWPVRHRRGRRDRPRPDADGARRREAAGLPSAFTVAAKHKCTTSITARMSSVDAGTRPPRRGWGRAAGAAWTSMLSISPPRSVAASAPQAQRGARSEARAFGARSGFPARHGVAAGGDVPADKAHLNLQRQTIRTRAHVVRAARNYRSYFHNTRIRLAEARRARLC